MSVDWELLLVHLVNMIELILSFLLHIEQTLVMLMVNCGVYSLKWVVLRGDKIGCTLSLFGAKTLHQEIILLLRSLLIGVVQALTGK